MKAEELGPLAEQIKKAAACAANYSGFDDGGTCNFDSVYVRAKGMTKAMVQDLQELSGVSLTLTNTRWHGRMLVLNCTEGQGARRTRMAEAAYGWLKTAGVDCGMYYQMD